MQILIILLLYLVSFAVDSAVLNNPYTNQDENKKIYYGSFAEQPKTLDPAKSYDVLENVFLAQIYEPILQYDYLARPYTLVPLTATSMPTMRYFNANGQQVLNNDEEKVAYSIYTIHIKPGIMYQPHPCFHINNPSMNTRELIVDDYIYQIKRLASPQVNSSIYGLMSQYIDGFDNFALQLPQRGRTAAFIDLRKYPLSGLKKIDDYTFEIKIKGQYVQFIYWLSMRFFSPLPWEADFYYSRPGMKERNMTLNWYPVGTGPFMLTENNPNSRMILDQNPNYHADYLPLSGSQDDQRQGYLKHAGEKLPMIDRAVYTLEKESIPRWSKFLQGYYDLSGISADSFDQTIRLNSVGQASLSANMAAKGMRLTQVIEPSISYLGFNMLDNVVGGDSMRARKLRQAISIAVNYDEFINIFLNGRGKSAQGPIPPGIFGFKQDSNNINAYVYKLDHGIITRRSIADAQQLMLEAGYPKGIDPATKNPLILHYDVSSTSGPEDKAQLDWMRKQFASIGIDLNVQSTQYNRFQEKVRTGNVQIYSWGWNADYPDPENFLFLLYGPNGKVLHGGENTSNYFNPEFDKLFDLMKNRKNDQQRQKLLDQMQEIVRRDSPWVWGIHSETFTLSQSWSSPVKSNTIGMNTLKYISIDVPKRNFYRQLWNQPILWPLIVSLVLLSLLLLPFIIGYYKKQASKASRLP